MSVVALKLPEVPFQNVPTAHAKPTLRAVNPPPAPWRDGNVRALCMSLGLEDDMLDLLDKLVTASIRLRKGDTLFRVGDAFTALYVIRSGSCKTVLLSECGKSQVAGYHMAGDILGITGIGTERHDCDAIALEDTEVCVMPFACFEEVNLDNRRFRQNFLGVLSREINRGHSLMLMLGTMRAEQRLAVFLLDLSRRYLARGYSPCEFVLRMTREEIGSYLGLQLETVSRLCTRFQQEGMIQVQGRAVKLLDHAALKQVISAE